jgi:hypothetical protein
MTADMEPVDAVVGCATHDAYRVEFSSIEDIDWASYQAADAEAALNAFLSTGATEVGDAEVLNLLKYEVHSSYSDQVTYAGLFGDGSVHASITLTQQPQGEVWAVTHAVVCTLEEVPEEEEEEEPQEFAHLKDDDLFED